MFRSAAGLVLVLPLIWLVVIRMRTEEALLASEFGECYAAYVRTTWRLVPWVY